VFRTLTLVDNGGRIHVDPQASEGQRIQRRGRRSGTRWGGDWCGAPRHDRSSDCRMQRYPAVVSKSLGIIAQDIYQDATTNGLTGTKQARNKVKLFRDLLHPISQRTVCGTISLQSSTTIETKVYIIKSRS